MKQIERILYIAVIASLLCAWLYSEWTTAQLQRQDANYINYHDTVKHYTDKQGNGHATISVQQIPADIYSSLKDSTIAALRKEVKKAKDLLQYTRMHLQVADSVTVPVHDTAFVRGKDTVHAEAFVYSDDYLEERGQIADSTLHLHYSYNMDITVTHAWKRPKWYKAKQLQVDITTPDPHATITSIQTITIAPSPKKWYETRGFAVAVGVFAGLLIKK